MTTALVIGGGVAGPVAAMALQRAGVEATVHEADPLAADDSGLFFTFQANGLDALRAVGAGALVPGFATTSMRFRSGSGKCLGEVGMGEPLADGTVGVTVRRADLHGALRDEALRRGIAVEYGHRLVDVVRTPTGVRAGFADGSHADADLLIGADGVHSRVREIIDPAAARARYVPVLNVGGQAPPMGTPARPGRYEMVFGRRAFFLYVVTPDGSIWWGANPPRRDEPVRGELKAVTTEQWRSQLLELFAPDRSPACAIIEATSGELAGWATYDMPSVRRWHRDRMIVIGDAAHATSPSSGQGASMAVEDAVEVARCLRDIPDVDAAFTVYEHLRRERVERVVAEGARWTNTKVAGPVGRVLRDAFMPRMLARAGRTGKSSSTWMHHHHITWDEPVGAMIASWARMRPDVAGKRAEPVIFER